MFGKNTLLRMSFKLCKELGIDDPCAWLSVVSPRTLDMWLAYELCEAGSKQAEMSSPEDVLKKLQQHNA